MPDFFDITNADKFPAMNLAVTGHAYLCTIGNFIRFAPSVHPCCNASSRDVQGIFSEKAHFTYFGRTGSYGIFMLPDHPKTAENPTANAHGPFM